MKYEIKLIEIDNSHSTTQYFEMEKFHFNEVLDFLTLVENHKKLLGGVKKMQAEKNEEINNKKAGEKEYTIMDEHRSGRVHLTKFGSPKGVSYSLSIGFKKDGDWLNKKIFLLEEEIPSVIKCLKELYEL